MTLSNIILIILAAAIIFIITTNVNKSSNGISGLMSSPVNGSKSKSTNKIDKPTKITLLLIVVFMFFCLLFSFNLSKEHRSVISNEPTYEKSKGE